MVVRNSAWFGMFVPDRFDTCCQRIGSRDGLRWNLWQSSYYRIQRSNRLGWNLRQSCYYRIYGAIGWDGTSGSGVITGSEGYVGLDAAGTREPEGEPEAANGSKKNLKKMSSDITCIIYGDNRIFDNTRTLVKIKMALINEAKVKSCLSIHHYRNQSNMQNHQELLSQYLH